MKTKQLFSAMLAALIIGAAPPAQAQPFVMKRVPPPLNVQVIGGQPANPDIWPATLIFRNADGGGCTATAVGDRVVLTAAHCVANGAAARVEVDAQGTTVDITCDHHPAYPADISADFALCLASASLRFPQRYEVVSQSAALVAVGRKVTLLGYGCLTAGGADKNFGQLFEGTSTISVAEPRDYVVTNGPAAVCFGDSGGAAFSQDPVARRVVAINSRGDISRNSWLSITSGGLFTNWARTWKSSQGARICGLHNDAVNCHQ